ncbi:MAG: PHP domain-containing protein, partial [Bryobacteraceae bacterium]
MRTVLMNGTRIHFQWSAEKPQSRFGAAVSLHSHTLHSREPLDFFYRIAKHCAPARWALRRSEARYQSLHGVPLDLRRGWWTPPLAPRDAYSVEFDQISSLGLAPIVSLTDHDDIDAPMSLQAMEGSPNIPISVEWTVPFRNTFFHLGVHNLPPKRARAIMDLLKAFTEQQPSERDLREILASLHAEPGMLTVFNHPLWDETGIGAEQHRTAAVALLSQHGEYLHAIELNGLRPWRENASAIRLAGDWSKPVISGGDRHVVEPNATLNLTNAGCFAEFASEVRSGWSDVLLASHYRTPYAARVFHNILDVFRTYQNHRLGWT